MGKNKNKSVTRRAKTPAKYAVGNDGTDIADADDVLLLEVAAVSDMPYVLSYVFISLCACHSDIVFYR